MTVLLPGDRIPIPRPSALDGAQQPIKLGPGTLRLGEFDPESVKSSAAPVVLATRAGVLGHVGSDAKGKGKGRSAMDVDEPSAAAGKSRKGEGWWVETNSKRYVPAPGDSVIGQVTLRTPDNYLLSLQSAHTATLPALAFEGATKRHRPNLKIGSLVYARVVLASRDMEPECTCVDPVTGKSEGYGELKVPEREEGVCMLFKCSLGLARSLLRPTHPLLPTLSSHFPFETAVGANGLVWVRASNAKHVVAFGRVLDAADRAASGQASAGGRGVAGQDEEDDEEEGADGEEVARRRGALDEKEITKIIGMYT